MALPRKTNVVISLPVSHGEELPAGRPSRVSPLYEKLLRQGCVYTETFGWERPKWFTLDGREENLSYRRNNVFEVVVQRRYPALCRRPADAGSGCRPQELLDVLRLIIRHRARCWMRQVSRTVDAVRRFRNQHDRLRSASLR